MAFVAVSGVPGLIGLLALLLLATTLLTSIVERPVTPVHSELWDSASFEADEEGYPEPDGLDGGGDEPGTWLPGADWYPE